MNSQTYSYISTTVFILVGLSIVLTGSAAAQSADIVVGPNGEADYQSIPPAIESASDGDRIEVQTGTYEGSISISKDITLIAPDGATIANTSTEESEVGIQILNDAKPTVSGFTVTNWRYGITAYDSAGDWVIQDSTIQDFSGRGLSVDGSIGAWRVETVTITGDPTADASVGIDAGRANGSWVIANATIRSVTEDGITTDGSSGDWIIRNTSISATRHSVDAYETSGGWTITSSELKSSRDDRAEVNAYNATGNWKISYSILTDGTGKAIATNSDFPPRNASYNYWGASDGPSGDFDGSGGSVPGNVIVTPYFTDSTLTTLLSNQDGDSITSSDGSSDSSISSDGSGDSTTSSDRSGDSTTSSDESDSDTGSSSAIATRFQQFTDGGSSLPGLIGIGLIVLVGGGVYRRLSDSDSELEPFDHTSSEADSSSHKTTTGADESEHHTTAYQDYDEKGPVRSTEYVEVSEAVNSCDQKAIALYSARGESGETIDASEFDQLYDGFETWHNIDDHQHILTVYTHGDTPKPWAAVELADGSFDPAVFADDSVATKRDMIVNLCDAVHEGHRYGLAHGGVEEGIFIVNRDESPSIKVGDWGITEAAINDEADQQADIDAVVDIAFELFTGESSSTVAPDSVSYPADLESVFETAWDHEGGYETVIHFRDAITKAI